MAQRHTVSLLQTQNSSTLPETTQVSHSNIIKGEIKMYTRTLNTRNTHPERGFYRPKTTAFYLVTEDKSFFIEDAIGEFLHICPLANMAEEDELLCEIWQRSTANATEMLHHHRHEEPRRLIAISQGKQYLVPRYNTDPRFSDGEHAINISQDLTDVTFSELNQPEGNNYYTIDHREFKEAMDKPEQVLASVINALRKEQEKG